jgi:hypothetical protein
MHSYRSQPLVENHMKEKGDKLFHEHICIIPFANYFLIRVIKGRVSDLFKCEGRLVRTENLGMQ